MQKKSFLAAEKDVRVKNQNIGKLCLWFSFSIFRIWKNSLQQSTSERVSLIDFKLQCCLFISDPASYVENSWTAKTFWTKLTLTRCDSCYKLLTCSCDLLCFSSKKLQRKSQWFKWNVAISCSRPGAAFALHRDVMSHDCRSSESFSVIASRFLGTLLSYVSPGRCQGNFLSLLTKTKCRTHELSVGCDLTARQGTAFTANRQMIYQRVSFFVTRINLACWQSRYWFGLTGCVGLD